MNAKSMMEFDGWLKRRSMDESWIAVAQHDATERDGWKEDLFMTSVLAPPGSDEALLTGSSWLAPNNFGEVEVGADGNRIEVQTEKRVGKNGDVTIEPFTFLRLWNGTWPSRFEIIQNFMLFYNLHFNATGNKYVAVDDAGETTDVVRTENEEWHEKIEIRAKFLQNYLACRGLVLVRQHDHQIHSDRTLAELGIESFRGRRLDSSDYAFELTVVDGGWTGEGPAVGVLKGKDLVRPRGKCQDLLGFPKGDCEFIVGVDDRGEEIMEPCAERGPEMFLTPVRFKLDVLKKYHDSPKYKVTQSQVSRGAYWGVKIHQNGNRVVALLGDLASLPANEQAHWRHYNVRPEKATRERGAEQVGCGPSEAGYMADLKIPEREDERNEFKETFSVTVKGGKANEVKMAVAKTVAAFANTGGGRLFIGVNDDGESVGLRRDLRQYKNSSDKLELAIRDFVRSKLRGPVNMKFDFSDGDYLVISVAKRMRPVYVCDDFYVRNGNSSIRLSSRETVEYLKERWSA